LLGNTTKIGDVRVQEADAALREEGILWASPTVGANHGGGSGYKPMKSDWPTKQASFEVVLLGRRLCSRGRWLALRFCWVLQQGGMLGKGGVFGEKASLNNAKC